MIPRGMGIGGEGAWGGRMAGGRGTRKGRRVSSGQNISEKTQWFDFFF